MNIFSRIGTTQRALAAAAVSFSLFAGVALAEEGYVDVRVRDDNAGCGPVVLQWSLDREEHPYDPNYAANDPKLDMAETRPLPVIHFHPALNAGGYYLPPQDGLYRHYFPESEAPPRLRRWNRAEYEEYLREHNPSLEIPYGVGVAPGEDLGVPGTIYVPTGMKTPPAAFVGTESGYIVAPAGPSAVEDVFAPVIVPEAVQADVVPAPEPQSGPEEGTASFIHLSSTAEQVPYVSQPEAAAASSLLSADASVPVNMVPAWDEPVEAAAPVGNCVAPNCQ